MRVKLPIKSVKTGGQNIITILIQSNTETTQVYQMSSGVVDCYCYLRMLLLSCLNTYICAYIFITWALVS